MAELEIIVDEYCLFYGYVHGTLFNGLEYDELIEDAFDINHIVYHVWNDLLSEELSLTEAFTPYHYLVLKEFFNFEEQFGLPIQVSATSLEVMHEQKVRPVDIAFFSLEVLHGVDIFWEEVSSGLHSTEYTQGVPYHFFENIDYLGLDVGSTVVKVNFAQSLDRLNMRHTVEQFYNFNNIISEQFFIYDWPSIGWGKLVDDGIDMADSAVRYLGFVFCDYLFTVTASEAQFIGDHTLSDKVFIYDNAKQVKGFTDILEEVLGLSGLLRAPYFDRALAGLGITDDLDLTNTITTLVLAEVMKAKATVVIGFEIACGIKEAMSMADEFTLSALTRDYVSTIEDGFNLSVEAAASFIVFRIIEDALTGEDTALTQLMIDAAIEDETGFEGSVN